MKDILVLGEYVLVKQTMTARKGKIILTDLAKNEDKYDFDFEIVELGDECKRKDKIKAGDRPVFEQYVQFHPVRLLESNNKVRSSLLAVHENSIIGIDNSKEEEKVEVPSILN